MAKKGSRIPSQDTRWLWKTQPLFCIVFNLSALLLGNRGGGPFAGLCPGALLFIIRPWLLSVSRLRALSDAALHVTMWPINCPELTERRATDQWIFTISSSSIQPSSLLPSFLPISLLRQPFTLECISPEADMLLFFLDSSHVTSSALCHYHTIPFTPLPPLQFWSPALTELLFPRLLSPPPL